MRATATEFRYRFWIFSGIFALGFGAYAVERTNTAAWIASLLRQSETDDAGVAVVFLLAAILAALGAALRTWAAAYLHTEVVHDPALHAERVVADGPYRHVRNPLYLGVLLAAFAAATLMSRTGALLTLLGVALFSLRLIAREEAALLETGDPGYARFRAAVPRLVPAARPRLPASGAVPRWGQAFLGEAYFWLFPVALLVVARTRDARHFLLLMGLGLLARGVLAQLWWRRGGRSRSAAP